MTLFVKNLETGETFPFDGVTTVDLITSDQTTSNPDFKPFYEGTEYVGALYNLDDKTMRIIFDIDKWQMTMLRHPRKKNRGLKRRLRKAREFWQKR